MEVTTYQGTDATVDVSDSLLVEKIELTDELRALHFPEMVEEKFDETERPNRHLYLVAK